MSFLVDTSVLIEIENENSEIIEKLMQLKDAPNAEFCISFFNFCEVYYGVLQKSEKHKMAVQERLQEYKILNTTLSTGILFCNLLFQLKKKGTLISQFDIFIAAFAIEHNLILLTRDDHFQRIPGLRVLRL